MSTLRTAALSFCSGSLLIPALILTLLSGFASGADPEIERIQKAYRVIKDIKGSFVQKSHIKDLERTDTFQGTFMIKLPSRMRWQYRGEDKSITEVVVNDGELIVYQKKERQAFRSRFDRENYGQAPISLLGGFGNIEKEFEVTKENGRLMMKPKRPMGMVLSVEITPSEGDFPIGSVAITDKRSNRIEITFKDVTLNSGIADKVFEFSLPRGASMYDYR